MRSTQHSTGAVNTRAYARKEPVQEPPLDSTLRFHIPALLISCAELAQVALLRGRECENMGFEASSSLFLLRWLCQMGDMQWPTAAHMGDGSRVTIWVQPLCGCVSCVCLCGRCCGAPVAAGLLPVGRCLCPCSRWRLVRPPMVCVCLDPLCVRALTPGRFVSVSRVVF
jgi:hypothetical protein